MLMVVGLGNPGRQYAYTRHNIGFMVVEELVRRHGVTGSADRSGAWTGRTRLGDVDVLLVKPHTFMNLSGEAVGRLWRWHKLELAQLLVVSDDIDLPLGRIRLRERGSAGGHNGLRSIFAHVGSQDVPRLKVGVGRPQGPGARDHVLSPFAADEREEVALAVVRAADAVELVAAEGVITAMNRVNPVETGRPQGT